MPHSMNDDNAEGIAELHIFDPEFIQQAEKEAALSGSKEKGLGKRKPWGKEIAILKQNGEIELTTFVHKDGDFCDGSDICEPGTVEYEEALKAHGPLQLGVPHGIDLYPDEVSSEDSEI